MGMKFALGAPAAVLVVMVFAVLSAAAIASPTGTGVEPLVRPVEVRLVDGAIEVRPTGRTDGEPGLLSMVYSANFADGKPAFSTRWPRRTEPAVVSNPVRTRLEVVGPSAAGVRAEVRITPAHGGVILEWTIQAPAPGKPFNAWTSGYRLQFQRPPTAARTAPAIRWIEPTGSNPWEVAGDVPYPDFDAQLREVGWDGAALRCICVTSWYDPDWFYSRNVGRTPFFKAGLSEKAQYTRRDRIFIAFTFRRDLPPEWGAAALRTPPVSVRVLTGRTGNLFEPGEPVRFEIEVTNVSADRRSIALDWRMMDWYGARVGGAENVRIDLAPWQVRRLPRSVSYDKRGILFFSARVHGKGASGAWRFPVCATFAVMPDRPSARPAPDSPFGLAALIANPERYPDQFDLGDVLPLVRRIGVHWLRTSMGFRAQPGRAARDTARRWVELLERHGVQVHLQTGARVLPPGEREAWLKKIEAEATCLKGLVPCVEVGNELNFGHSAEEYIEEVLRPSVSVLRKALPEVRIFSMGLGGVNRKWLAAFEKGGGMEQIDVLSIHPGCHPRAPEHYAGWRGWFFPPQVMDAAAARRHGKEVWITEAYAPTPPGAHGLDLRTAADYLVRTYVLALAAGVGVVEWYQFQDGVWHSRIPRPNDVEYNFGIVYSDLQPKPAYVAYGVMTEQLEGFRCEGRLDLGASDLYGFRFRNGERCRDVLWSYRFKHELDRGFYAPDRYAGISRRPWPTWRNRWVDGVRLFLPASARTVRVTDVMGNTREERCRADGRVALTLTGSPVFVEGLGALPAKPGVWAWPYDEFPE